MPIPNRSEIVSNDRDLPILVNTDNEEIGTLDKVSCHANEGVLLRAISVLLLNSNGDVLLQQRNQSKAFGAAIGRTHVVVTHARTSPHTMRLTDVIWRNWV